jgi:hypothetical protein
LELQNPPLSPPLTYQVHHEDPFRLEKVGVWLWQWHMTHSPIWIVLPLLSFFFNLAVTLLHLPSIVGVYAVTWEDLYLCYVQVPYVFDCNVIGYICVVFQ